VGGGEEWEGIWDCRWEEIGRKGISARREMMGMKSIWESWKEDGKGAKGERIPFPVVC